MTILEQRLQDLIGKNSYLTETINTIESDRDKTLFRSEFKFQETISNVKKQNTPIYMTKTRNIGEAAHFVVIDPNLLTELAIHSGGAYGFYSQIQRPETYGISKYIKW